MNESRLLILDGENGKILSFTTDGTEVTVILEKCGGTPDGIAIDPVNKHIYWTNMGKQYDQNDGFIERVNFDGTGRKVIIPKGATFTPKQLKLDLINRKIYWCDREGMRVMRAEMDGSGITTLIQSGVSAADRKNEMNHCVGIAIDLDNGHIYWTQKGPSDGNEGRIFRAGLAIPEKQNAHSRNDIQILFERLPEPIDLEIDPLTGNLYWTDRGLPPQGNTLNRANVSGLTATNHEILSEGLKEAIGLTLDRKNQRIFFVDLGGNLYGKQMNGSVTCHLYAGPGRFTGIAFAEEGLK